MTPYETRLRARRVTGPDGSPLSIADLPPAGVKRWGMRKKAIVVAAVRGGLITIDEACRRYELSIDEFLSWKQKMDQYGLPGLRASRVQDYRD